MVYFVVCFISAIIGTIAGSQERLMTRRVLSVLSIIPFCFLAAFRAYTVGTDVMVYAYPVFLSAPYLSLPKFLAAYTNVEVGFKLIIWLVSYIAGNNFQIMLFVFELLIIIPIMLVAERYVPNEIGVVNLVFGLLFFGFGLSVIRQCIASSILLLAGSYAWERKFGKYIAAMGIALSFHYTSILGIIIWPLVSLYTKDNNSSGKSYTGHLGIIIICFAFICTCILLGFGDEVISIAGQIKESFGTQYRFSNQAGVTISFIVYAIIALFWYNLACRNAIKSEYRRYRNGITVLMITIVLSAILAQFSVLSSQLNRIGWLFLNVSCIFWGLVFQRIRKQRILSMGLIAAVHTVFFIWFYVIGGIGEIYPYFSTIFPQLNF